MRDAAATKDPPLRSTVCGFTRDVEHSLCEEYVEPTMIRISSTVRGLLSQFLVIDSA